MKKRLKIKDVSLDVENLVNRWIDETLEMGWIYKRDDNGKIIGVSSYPSFFEYDHLFLARKLESTLGKGKMFYWAMALERMFFPEYFKK